MTINERVVDEIKNIAPGTLEAHGVIQRAKTTVNREPTYICPFCGNGTGNDGDGLVVSTKNGIYTYTCFGGCGQVGYDNVHLLAKYYNLNSQSDFIEVCKRACDDFGIYCSDFSTKSATSKVKQAKNSATDDNELDLIRSDIAAAKVKLPKFIANQGGSWRGLTLETLQHFDCGFIGNWTSPKSRATNTYSTPTPRIIIPAGDHYLARLTVPVETFDEKTRQFIRPKTHAGIKTPFNVERVTYNILIVVEGEIDAMSIWQATGRDVVATCGVGGYTAFTAAVKGKNNLSVIILFDNDSAGRTNAEKFKQALLAEGVQVALAFLADDDSKIDANDILINQGQDALKAKIEEIFSSAVFDSYSKRSITRAFNDSDDKLYKTSKEIIPSCPVDVDIPPNFLFDKFSIKNNKGHTIVSTPIVVTKVFEPHDNEVAAVEIAFYKHNSDSWHFITIDFATVADNKKILQLASFGITVVQEFSKFLSIFIMRMIDCGKNIHSIPLVNLYGKPGWHGDTFISPYDMSYTIKSSGVDYYKAFASSGNKIPWTEYYIRAIGTSPVARLILGAALAAPLLKICNLRSSQIHLACPSGNGKSAVVKLALSLYGNPAELYRTFNSTGNSILEWATKFNDLPHGLDELQAASKRDREKVDDLIYQLSGQQGRGRLSRDGALKKVSTFRALRLSTGEQKLTSNASGQGAIRRVLEITYPVIFLDSFAARIHELLDNGNFGFYGELWINFIANPDNRDKITDCFSAFYERALAFLPNAIPDHLKIVALCYAALYLLAIATAHEACSPDFISSTFESDIRLLMEGVPDKFFSSNTARARDALSDYLFTHSSFFRNEQSDGVFTAENNPREIYGIKFNDGSVGFFKTGLIKILDDCGFPSAEAIIRAFIDEGVFQGNNKPPHSGQLLKCVDNSRKRTWLFVFKTEYLNCLPDESV